MSLSARDADKTTDIDTMGLDFAEQTQFYQSALCAGFLEHPAVARIKECKRIIGNEKEKAFEIITELFKMPITEDQSKSVRFAHTWFGPASF